MAVYISLIGPSEASPEILDLAEQTGRCVAGAGAILVTGGKGGAMEAACRGARSAGGRTVGILPGSSRAEANPFVDIAIPTGMGEMRNALVVRTGDAVVAVGGGVGTLSELALALKLGKPVAGLLTWSARAAGSDLAVPSAGTPQEAVASLMRQV